MSIDDVPVQELKVEMKQAAVESKIGSSEFTDAFIKLIKTGNVWRTAKGLADKLGVDPIDLVKWMEQQPAICKKPGKEDGIFYYAAIDRLEKPEKPKGMERKVITEEDRYMTALFYNQYGNYLKILEKYALRAHEKNPEAFTALAQARDRMSAGVALLINSLGSDLGKLPKI